MKKFLLQFDGVQVRDGAMTGTMLSSELITHFDKSWIPDYQRERVMSTSKINKLISIYKSKGHIDSIKLNFKGTMLEDTEQGITVLEGGFSVIDGQQRLFALKDSMVMDIKVPVELYIGISLKEEIKLFHQYNKDGTKLKFGELVKSSQGSYGLVLKRTLKKKDLSLPITVNNSKTGLSLSTLCPIIHVIHNKRVNNYDITRLAAGKGLLKFFENQFNPAHVEMVEYTFKKLMTKYVSLFGDYDNRVDVYRPVFFKAFCRLSVREFMKGDGSFDYGKFEEKIIKIPTHFMRNAYVREKLTGSDGAYSSMEIELVRYLNHKLKGGHLKDPPLPQYEFNYEEEKEHEENMQESMPFTEPVRELGINESYSYQP